MRTRPGLIALTGLLVLLLIWPAALFAQEAGPPQSNAYSQEQLDQLLAPIALYPDPLLSQILMASTYPLEVVEADRWLKQSGNLAGDALDEALKDQPWDVSVKSLCHFPQVLAMMDEKLPETTDLGNAFLGQQDQVMSTVQKLRARAREQGTLASTQQQNVAVQDQDIVIQPAQPEVVYVPAYDPCSVYGAWWYPACSPPWFWYPGLVAGVGFYWGPAVFVGPIDFWCGFNWHRHSIFVNVNKTAFVGRIGATRMHGGAETWAHDPAHRRGVAYHDAATAQRFGRAGAPGMESRQSFRGFAPQGRAGGGPGGPGPQGSGRPGAQPHVGATNEPGVRSAQQRPGGPGNQAPAQPRGGAAFQGFGSTGIQSQQHSERGRQSIGAPSPAGGPSESRAPSQGRSAGPAPRAAAPSGGGGHGGGGGGGGHPAPVGGGGHGGGGGGGGGHGGGGGGHQGR